MVGFPGEKWGTLLALQSVDGIFKVVVVMEFWKDFALTQYSLLEGMVSSVKTWHSKICPCTRMMI